jgi:hypothetical protein
MQQKYIAEIHGAHEVSLRGTADYEYWKDRLAHEELAPIRIHDRAQILLSAVELKWMGVRFSELSVSISVHEIDDPTKSGIYLAAAFNTSKLFTFFERHWFHTPYHHAQVNVIACEPWSFQLTDGEGILLKARRHGMTQPTETHTAWEGPIYLPHRPVAARKRFQVFFARLSGATEIVPFDSSQDSNQLAPSKRNPIFQSLLDSRFTAIEWRVRSNATHARSKTYNRGVVL